MGKLKIWKTIFSRLGSLNSDEDQFILTKDSQDMYVDIEGERIHITDFIEVADNDELLATLAPITTKFYYVKSTNEIWRWVDEGWKLINNIVDSEHEEIYSEVGKIIVDTNTSIAKLSSFEGDTGYDFNEDGIFVVINDLNQNVNTLTYNDDTAWEFSQTLIAEMCYALKISTRPASGADYSNGSIDVLAEAIYDETLGWRVKDLEDRVSTLELSGGSGSATAEEPTYKTIGFDEAVSDIYEGGFVGLNIQGYKYGEFYGVDSAGYTENVYLSPEGKAFSATNPKTLCTTKGTVTLCNSDGETKSSIAIDLCGNDNVRDEIDGISLIRRWSDDFMLTTANEKETGDIGLNGYDYFIFKVPEQSMAQPPKRVASNEVANLVTVGYTTVAHDNITDADVKTAISLHYDSETDKHIFTFKVKNGFFTTATNFVYEFQKGNYKTYLRYELAEYAYTSIFFEPFGVEVGDYFTFTPDYTVSGYNGAWGAVTITSVPYSFECNIYGNTAAKIKGANEQSLLSAVVKELLDGSGNGTTTILELASGTDITSPVQSAATALSASGGTVYINNGEYTASGTVTIPKDVTIVGLGTVKITTSSTSLPVFTLACGSTLKNVSIVTPLNYSSSAVLIGGTDVDYRPYSTTVENITITGTTAKDSDGNTTVFTGYGIGVIAQHVNSELSRVYNANGNNIQVYNMEHGIHVYADGVIDYIANTYFQNMYIENCYIGIYNKGYSSTFTGYCIQTKVNNLYGVYTTAGYFTGHVFDLDLYNDNDTTRPNIGHPKVGYFMAGKSTYGFISDPIYTEYQGKYGYDWDERRPDDMLATINNTWCRFRPVNEVIQPLKADGTLSDTQTRKADFNGLIDNYLSYADERFTVTTNITADDIIKGDISNIFDPNKVNSGEVSATEGLVLANRTTDNPYIITIDFGRQMLIATAGMDFGTIPKTVQMESWDEKYETESNRSAGQNWTDDNYLIIYSEDNNRLPVIQTTWSGSGSSPCQRLRFKFADLASVTGQYIILNNLYSYSLYEPSLAHLPSSGGYLYHDGKITVNANHEFTDDNEYVSKKWVEDKTSSYAKTLNSAQTAYDTGRVWLNGEPIIRQDYCVAILRNSTTWQDGCMTFTMLIKDSSLTSVSVLDCGILEWNCLGTYSNYAEDATLSIQSFDDFCPTTIDVVSREITFDNTVDDYDCVILTGHIEYVRNCTISNSQLTELIND